MVNAKAKRRAKIGLRLAAIAVTLFLIGKFVITPSVVIGVSMSPTLKPYELALILHTRHYQPHRGDIVVFRTTDDPPLYFIKRVIALPGETIGIERGAVKINGAPLAEPYTTANRDWNTAPTPVPAGKVFVIGDNRELGSHDYVLGLVATRLVRARLVWHWRWKR